MTAQLVIVKRNSLVVACSSEDQPDLGHTVYFFALLILASAFDHRCHVAIKVVVFL